MHRFRLALVLVLTAACGKSAAPVGQPAPRGIPAPEGWAAPPPAPGATTPSPVADEPAPATAQNPHGDLPPGHPSIDSTQTAPAAPADAANFLDGTIDVAPALKGQVGAAKIIFLSAKPVDASGQVAPVPIAVASFPVGALPAHFHLTAADSMTGGGGGFQGTVMLTARADGDSNATSRNPGDVEGKLQATIPAKDLKIVLDTPVQ